MKKALSEMSRQELWQLFPIFLVPPSEDWKRQYAKIGALLRSALSGFPVARISHIGSTAVSGIWAKAIVDVLVEMSADADPEAAAAAIEAAGFTRMSSEPGRVSFNRGYTVDGFADEVYHVHLRRAGDNDELYFRDYLNEHPQVAREYEALKLRLWRMYEHDRDGYTDAKTPFIREWTARAREAYAGRYG